MPDFRAPVDHRPFVQTVAGKIRCPIPRRHQQAVNPAQPFPFFQREPLGVSKQNFTRHGIIPI